MLTLSNPAELVWQRFAEGRQGALGAPDLRSRWQRALAQGARFEGLPAAGGFVSRPDLDERMARHDRMRHVARSVVGGLSDVLSQTGYVGLLTDPDGVILDSTGGGAFLARAAQAQLVTGARWSEDLRGTNAIGTALAEGCAVTVEGRAHLHQANHGLVCYAAPIHGPDGAVAGLLDLTGRLRSASAFARGLAPALAAQVTERWRVDAYDRALPGGLLPLLRSLDQAPAPAAFVDAGGRLRHLNPALQALVGPVVDLQALCGHGWRQLEGQTHVTSARTSALAGRGLALQPVGDAARPIARVLYIQQAGPGLAAAVPAPRPRPTPPFAHLDGGDLALQALVAKAERLAPTDIPLLLASPTGTGKALLARAIHAASARAAGAFVSINCAAFGESLVHSELFGYGVGAFNGAERGGRAGFVEAADGGTLYLEEVSELPPSAQAALLGFLEHGQFYRVGETTLRRADVRVISATSGDLSALAEAGRFRSDLVYRLRGAQLSLPPLAERDDLASLAELFVARAAAAQQRPVPWLTPPALAAVLAHRWPGNFRELKQSMQVAVALCGGGAIARHHLPDNLRQVLQGLPVEAAGDDDLRAALAQAGGNVSEAARLLGVARSTVYRRLAREPE